MIQCRCGHTGLLPEQSGVYLCSDCGRELALNWFDSYEEWHRWALDRIFHPPRNEPPRAKVIFVPEEEL